VAAAAVAECTMALGNRTDSGEILGLHRRLIYTEHTRTHAEGADPRVWGLARAGLRVA